MAVEGAAVGSVGETRTTADFRWRRCSVLRVMFPRMRSPCRSSFIECLFC